MAKKLFNTDNLTNIGNAIRDKLGVTTEFKVSEMAAAIASIPVGGEQPQLYAPTIAIENDILTITTNSNNGSFNDGSTFTVYVDDVAFKAGTKLTYDLFTLTGMTGSLRKIKVVQHQSKFIDSDYSNDATWDTNRNALRITAKGGTIKIKVAVNTLGGMKYLSESPDIHYKKNNDAGWTAWFSATSGTSIEEVTLNDGEFITVVNDKQTLGNTGEAWVRFVINTESTGVAIATGNIMSMLNNVENMPEYALDRLFQGCSKLTLLHDDSLSEEKYLTLPRTKLSKCCYYGLFMSSGITELPNELPAVEMEEQCYAKMFAACTSLNVDIDKTNIIRNVLKLADACMWNMFSGCTSMSLNILLPIATMMMPSCYANMFEETNLPRIADMQHITALADGCFGYMYKDCKRLEISIYDVLIGTAILYNVYIGMFEGCTAITKLPKFNKEVASIKRGGFKYMFSGCTSLNVGKQSEEGTTAAIILPSNISVDGVDYMFEGVPTYHDTGWTDGTPNAGETIYYK